ncbi:MAG: DUF1634 domain-containing protein [Candidatus Carbobacillus sp.]|nr:DUF1634 domain-containing protein [Candidatus Carbobacillus sp.]
MSEQTTETKRNPEGHKDHAAPEALGLVETTIAYILRIGVAISMGVVTISLIALIIHDLIGGGQLIHTPYPEVFTHPSVTFDPRSFTQLWHGLMTGNLFSWMSLGLLLLILTPVVRVLVSIYAFIKEKDRLYTCITSFVLGVLLLSFFLGRYGI